MAHSSPTDTYLALLGPEFELRVAVSPDEVADTLSEPHFTVERTKPGILIVRKRGWFTAVELELRVQTERDATHIVGRIRRARGGQAIRRMSSVFGGLVLGPLVLVVAAAAGMAVTGAIAELPGLGALSLVLGLGAGSVIVLGGLLWVRREVDEGTDYQIGRDAKELLALVGPKLTPLALPDRPTTPFRGTS